MLTNEKISHYGFCEELNVIKQESVEWKEDLEQLSEDLMLYNGFRDERISKIIIGNRDDIEKITVDNLK